jgi:hypothetical protein
MDRFPQNGLAAVTPKQAVLFEKRTKNFCSFSAGGCFTSEV